MFCDWEFLPASSSQTARFTTTRLESSLLFFQNLNALLHGWILSFQNFECAPAWLNFILSKFWMRSCVVEFYPFKILNALLRGWILSFQNFECAPAWLNFILSKFWMRSCVIEFYPFKIWMRSCVVEFYPFKILNALLRGWILSFQNFECAPAWLNFMFLN